MNTPQITKISLLRLPFITPDSYEILVNIKNFDNKKQRIIVQAAMKNYDLTGNTITIKIPARPNSNNTISGLAKQNNNLRIKAFVYDFVDNKILESKLQEFEQQVSAPAARPTLTAKTFNSPNDVGLANYAAISDLVSTVPVILGWKKKTITGRQILKILASKGKAEKDNRKEFIVDLYLNDFDFISTDSLSNQSIEVEIDKQKFKARMVPKQPNHWTAKVNVVFNTVVLLEKNYTLKATIISTFILSQESHIINSKSVDIKVLSDGSIINTEEESGKLNRDFFFKQYISFYGKISSVKSQNIKLFFDAIEEYYSVEKKTLNLYYLSYMIATVKHETDDTYKPINEYGGNKYFEDMYDPILGKNEKRRKMAMSNGNTTQGDGVKYHGRGYVMITWKDNYERMGTKFNVDLVNYPEKALEIGLAAKILLYGSEKGTFTGVNLSDYISEGNRDYYNARRVINGLDDATLISGYAVNLEKCLKFIE